MMTIASDTPPPRPPEKPPSPMAYAGGCLGLLLLSILAAVCVIGGMSSCDDSTPGPYFPTPSPMPTATATPTPTLEQIIAEELKKLTPGQIVFAVPENMKQGKSERAEVRITSAQIGPRLTEGLKSRGTPHVEDISVSNSMKVVLYGENDEFRITKPPNSTDEQLVTGREYAQWEWQVTPLSFGEHTLYLKATATIRLEQLGEKAVEVPLMEKKINVSISPMYIVSSTAKKFDWWQFLLGGGVLSGIGVSIWRYLTRKKRRRAGFRPD